MPHHARVRFADPEALRDLRVAQRLAIRKPDHLARTLRDLGQAVLETHHVLARVLRRVGRVGEDVRGVHLPERVAPFTLADAVSREVLADAEDEPADARGILHRPAPERVDEEEHDVLLELADRIGGPEPPAREGRHRRREARTQLALRTPVAAVRAHDEVRCCPLRRHRLQT